ncbi:hypothetical protein DFH07DRAFT_991987 [Mycena maculata]|uniref:Uncharacterized protein n=1 Tax=Mycena maculata TaxID=230809 RepID=A0AAD7I0A1_9AGAR|nr:hypothetical protein DFH07DRAFT_991987 [Mycena maculata]
MPRHCRITATAMRVSAAPIPTTPATQKRNALLVTAYEGEFAQKADLKEFLKLLRPDTPDTETFTLLTTDGGINTQNASEAGVEANLDTQYTTGIATEVPIQFLSVGGKNFATSLLDTTTFLDGISKPPTVHEMIEGTGVSRKFGLLNLQRMHGQLCQLVFVLGPSACEVLIEECFIAKSAMAMRPLVPASSLCLLMATVVCTEPTTLFCANNTFMLVLPGELNAIQPLALSSMGSTQGFAPEKAINFTGGGFPNIFPAAFYQTAQVPEFLKTVPANFPGTFNETRRGYPDAAVQRWNFEIVVGWG